MKSTFADRKTILFISMIFCLLCLGGCVTAKQKLLDSGIKPLSEADYQSLLSQTFKADYYNISKGTISDVVFSPDGTVKFEAPKFSDEGKWRIVSGQQCSQWNKIRGGKETCFTWFKTAEGKYDVFDSSGTKKGRMTVK